MKALIIGGGIGGLSAAIALRRVGITAAVYEQADTLREVGAGLFVWTNAVKALRKLGVMDSALATGSTLDRFETRTWRGEVLTETAIGKLAQNLGAPVFIIDRSELLRLLIMLTDSHFIHCHARCVGFEQNSDGVTACFADGRTETGDVLIGADGLYSVIRAKLIGESKPRYAGYTCWRGLAEFEYEQLEQGCGFESWGPGRRFAMHHCGRGRIFWYASKNCPAGTPVASAGHQIDVLKAFQDWHTPIPELIQATLTSAILRNDIVDRKPAEHWGVGRVTLLGDAAHPITPNLGLGACLAIEDAVVLASCLRAAPDPVVALRSYESRRQARTASITNQSWRIGKICQWNNPLACWLRNKISRTSVARRNGLRLLEKVCRYEAPDLE